MSRGDRVLIYMPMIPEAVEAMLATVRLGAIHSVVFGGKITKSKVIIYKSYCELSLLVQCTTCTFQTAQSFNFKKIMEKNPMNLN